VFLYMTVNSACYACIVYREHVWCYPCAHYIKTRHLRGRHSYSSHRIELPYNDRMLEMMSTAPTNAGKHVLSNACGTHLISLLIGSNDGVRCAIT